MSITHKVINKCYYHTNTLHSSNQLNICLRFHKNRLSHVYNCTNIKSATTQSNYSIRLGIIKKQQCQRNLILYNDMATSCKAANEMHIEDETC